MDKTKDSQSDSQVEFDLGGDPSGKKVRASRAVGRPAEEAAGKKEMGGREDSKAKGATAGKDTPAGKLVKRRNPTKAAAPPSEPPPPPTKAAAPPPEPTPPPTKTAAPPPEPTPPLEPESSDSPGANGASASDGGPSQGPPASDPEPATPAPDRVIRLINNREGCWKVLADGDRVELSEEEWRIELGRQFKRETPPPA